MKKKPKPPPKEEEKPAPGERSRYVAMAVWASGKHADDAGVAEAAAKLSRTTITALDVAAWRTAKDPQDWEEMRGMVRARVRRSALDLAVTLADPEAEHDANMLKALAGLGVRGASQKDSASDTFGRYAGPAIRAVQARLGRRGKL